MTPQQPKHMTTTPTLDDVDTATAAARVPTRVEVVSHEEGDNKKRSGDANRGSHRNQPPPPRKHLHLHPPKQPRLDEADVSSLPANNNNVSVVIRLTAQEVALFQVIVDTVEAFATGQISLPPASKVPLVRGASINKNPHYKKMAEEVANAERIADSDDTTHAPPPPPQRPVVRVAGGWVRDKVLGLETHDIDLAVDTLTGVQLAQLIVAYAKAADKQSEIFSSSSGRIGVICANPAQSKHLETATLRLCGVDVDISNLRGTEEYDDHSRIPTVRFGTPREDADRRDFTMNALYFELHAQSIEDWTGRGLVDLQQGVLVTPLEPVQTFQDDPLRVLRAIRFAVRYQFELHPDLAAAAKLPQIHQALHRKVSRERVGKELEGMLSPSKGRARPLDALKTVARLQLAGSVFCLPQTGQDHVTGLLGHVLGEAYETDWDLDHPQARALRQKGWEEAERFLAILPNVLNAHELQVAVREAPSQDALAPPQPQQHDAPPTTWDRRLLPLAVYLLPFRTLRYHEKNKTEKSHNAVQYVFQHGIKFKQVDVRASALLQETVDRMAQFLRDSSTPAETMAGEIEEGGRRDSLLSRQQVHVSRLEAGLLLRSLKEQWPTCLLLATVLVIRQEQRLAQESENSNTEAEARTDGIDETVSRRIVQRWSMVSCAVHNQILDELDLDLCWKTKPLLDGKDLIQSLDLPKGPMVGVFLQEQVEWMLQHPNGTREECLEHLKAFKLRRENA